MDLAILCVVEELEESGRSGVVAQVAHGEAGKKLILRLGIREAAKTVVVRILAGHSELADPRRRLEGDVVARRKAINELDRMGRHVCGPSSSTEPKISMGPMFVSAPFSAPGSSGTSETGSGLCRVKLSVAELGSMHSARFCVAALRRLASGHPRWWEGAPAIGWLVAVSDPPPPPPPQDRPLPVRTHR